MVNSNNEIIDSIFDSSLDLISKSKELSNIISDATDAIITSLENNGKIIIFGNGGSAADAQHLADNYAEQWGNLYEYEVVPCGQRPNGMCVPYV